MFTATGWVSALTGLAAFILYMPGIFVEHSVHDAEPVTLLSFFISGEKGFLTNGYLGKTDKDIFNTIDFEKVGNKKDTFDKCLSW
jgi:hypothetical protein